MAPISSLSLFFQRQLTSLPMVRSPRWRGCISGLWAGLARRQHRLMHCHEKKQLNSQQLFAAFRWPSFFPPAWIGRETPAPLPTMSFCRGQVKSHNINLKGHYECGTSSHTKSAIIDLKVVSALFFPLEPLPSIGRAFKGTS